MEDFTDEVVALNDVQEIHQKKYSKFSTQCGCAITPIGQTYSVQPIGAQCLQGWGDKVLKIL